MKCCKTVFALAVIVIAPALKAQPSTILLWSIESLQLLLEYDRQ
jgi:hypothetical protein